MKRIFFSLLLAGLCFSQPAWALDLNQARSQGMLGEKRDGFVEVLGGGGEAQALASEVNARRKQEYERISKENGQPVAVVGTLASEQIISKLPAGSKYQAADGSWKTR